MVDEILSVLPNVHIDEEFDHLIPRMFNKELKSFIESVKDHGFDKPVIDVLPDGTILDGRHRFLAAQKLGPSYLHQLRYQVKKMNREQAIDYVVRQNKDRNNLTTSQLAAIAAEKIRLISKYRENAKKNQSKFRGNRFTTKKVESSRVCDDSTKKASQRSTQIAADEVGVGARTVQQAQKINRESKNAFDRVMSGKETINHAYNELPSVKAKQLEKKSKKNKSVEKADPEKAKLVNPHALNPIDDQYRQSFEEHQRIVRSQKLPTKISNLRTEGKKDAYMAAINMRDLFPDTADIIEDYKNGLTDAWLVLKQVAPDSANHIKKSFNLLCKIMNSN